MNQSYLRRIYLRLAGVVMLIVMLALAANAIVSHRSFERALAPDMAKKVATVGASIRSLVLMGVEHHIRFDELYGVEQKFDEVKTQIPEIASFAITDTQGKVLHQRLRAPAGAEEYFARPSVLAALERPQSDFQSRRIGQQYLVSLPIIGQQGPLGMLHIGLDTQFIDNIVLGMSYDVLVVLVVALFFTLELLNFLAGARLKLSLKTLGDVIDRGAAGDFAEPTKRRAGTDFATVANLLGSVLNRVNAGYAALTRDIDQARLSPVHERPIGLATVQAQAQALAGRCQFGAPKECDRANDDLISKVRAPLFLFILAEELTRSFLPSYVKGLLVTLPGLSPEVLVALPITLFMLVVALAQPYLGAYIQRVGQRRAMMIGAAVASAGFFASALAATVLDLLLWRSMCAIGYALVFVAAQAYVLDHAAPGQRARSFAVFIGAIMAASVCGPSIGGILADNVGERATFFLAALIALGSVAAMRLMPAHRADPTDRVPARAPSLRQIGSLLLNRRFMSVTGLAAMPAKIVLTGICFYLVPLYLLSISASQAMTGRVLMTYAVMMVLIGPWSAALASSRERMQWLVGGGLMISGLGGMVLIAGATPIWVFAAVILVGLGQSLSMSAQSALVGEHCEQDVQRMGESAVYGVYRLLERLGNALGPILASLLVMQVGYIHSFVAIGGLALVCGALFLLTSHRRAEPALVPA